MRTSTDFSPLYRSFIGFDHLAGLIDKAARSDKQSSYPPYNIELLSQDKYRITMAVAGFSEQVPTAEVGQCLGLLGNQDMSEAKGKAFVELSMQFLTPRIYQAIDIGNFYGIGVDENEITSLEIYPNPAESQFEIQSNSAIESIKIYSITGNLVKDIQNVNATNYTVQRNEMTSGVYIISIVNENSTNTRRLILK